MKTRTQASGRILIVDDNPENARLISIILQEHNFASEYAENGQIAIETLRNNFHFDLILLDINMPIMNGFETMKAIMEDEHLKEIPVIFLTSFSDLDKKMEGFELGAKDYVTVPFQWQELMARVKTHVELRHNREKLKKVNVWLQSKIAEKTKELQKANQDLKKLDNLKTNFLIKISQEFRSPLNNIVGTLNLIKNTEHSAVIKNLLETLDISIAGLELFIKKTILSSQLTLKSYPAQFETINLPELLQYAIIDLNEKINAKELQLEADTTDSYIPVNADSDLLYQTLVFILDNAIKYSVVQGKISIELRADKQKVTCTINDSGKGFTPEAMALAFEPFQLENHKNSINNGLSLYIVKQIMELHNGEISLSMIKKPDNGMGGSVSLKMNTVNAF